MRNAVIDRQSLYRQSNVNRLSLNVIYHLNNTSMPYGPFSSSKFEVRACNQNAYNQNAPLIGWLETQVTDQHRSLQHKYVFLTKTNMEATRWWLWMRDTYPSCHKIHWPPAHVRSHDQLKTKCLLFCDIYGHKTWQGSGL